VQTASLQCFGAIAILGQTTVKSNWPRIETIPDIVLTSQSEKSQKSQILHDDRKLLCHFDNNTMSKGQSHQDYKQLVLDWNGDSIAAGRPASTVRVQRWYSVSL